MRAAKKTTESRKVLQELVPLNSLSSERFDSLVEKIVIEEVKSGRYLFRKGDRDNQTIYLLAGKISLMDLDNFICSSHLGASTFEAQENVARDVASQIVQFLQTGHAANIVNLRN